jgi:23S rRNA pseudouridine1911/1915/1917 synthase
LRIVVTDEEAGQRADQLLAGRLGISRARARKLLEAGELRRGRTRLAKGDFVAAGDELALDDPELDPSARPDPAPVLTIAHEDAQLVVVDKPAGMPSHPLAPGELGCVANALLARFPEMLQVGYDSRQAGLVNRLDNDTSGLLLAARDRATFEALRDLLASGQVEKRYLALTERAVSPGMLEGALAPRGARVAVVPGTAPGAQPAQSRVVACRPLPHGRFLVELEVSRAYRHQVRVHLAAVSAPLVGDVLYGGTPAPHHFLHASRLAFTHPVTGKRIDVTSALPPDWPPS